MANGETPGYEFADTATGQDTENLGGCPDGYFWDGNKCVKADAGEFGRKLEEYNLQFQRQQAAKDAIEEAKKAKEAATELIGTYDTYLDDLGTDIEALPGRVAAAGAQALAPVYGQFGMGASAATPAAALAGSQISLQAQRAGAAQLRQLKDDLQSGKISQKEAEIAAHDLGIQVQQMIMEQPDPSEFSAKKDADYQAAINEAIRKGKGFWDDDEDQVFSEIWHLVDNEPDPLVVEKIRKRACGVLKSGGLDSSSDSNVSTCHNAGFQTDVEDI